MSAMYSFLFDRKSLTLLICGFVVGGGLLFFSGVLVGVYWSLPYGTEIQARAVSPLPRAAPRPAPAPVPAAAPPAPERRIELPTAPPAPVPPPGPVAEESEAIGLPKTVPAAPVPPPAPLAAARPVASGEARYSVQVGAFAQLSNSRETMAQLARRGYEPYVVEVRGASGSVLHMVRLGRYPDRGAAARAASDFRRKERMEAIVAPLPRGELSATSG